MPHVLLYERFSLDKRGGLMVLVASKLAVERPDEIALRDTAVALRWSEVDDILNRAVNAIGALDLGPDRRLAVLAENSAETVLAHLGGLLAGASTVPVNFHLNVDEVAFILADSGSRVLFVGPETVATGVEAARKAGVPTVIGWRTGDTPGVTSWEQWLDAAPTGEPSPDVAPRPNLMYTSGTTGRPKGVELPPTMFAGGGTMAEHVAALGRTGFASLGTHLVVGPMYHTGPLSGVRLLAAGVPVVVLGRFDAEHVLQAIDTYRAASTVMVPTHFVRLLALPTEVREQYDVGSLRLVAHTGASCPIDVKRQMIEWFGPVLQDSYGATEVGTTCTISSAEWLEHPGSVGRAIAPFRAIVVGDDDEELPPDHEGRLYFEDATGRGIIYPGDPEKTAQAHLRPGVFTLGEIGYVTADGYVYITDRFSDMVVSGGANIYPAEAEQVLVEHPGVADVAVIGVPNADMGEEVKALVVPRDPTDPPSPDELIAWCRERLAGYKCPRSVEIVDTVGRNAMGKLNKRALRKPYWEGAGTGRG
jgi:long-chain acyl-CoA synthetase